MHVKIIAEAGVNHNGSIEAALALVDAAAAAGADCIKFQTFDPAAVLTSRARQADYQTQNVGKDGSQLDMVRSLALSPAAFEQISARARERGLRFLSTPFDDASLDFLVLSLRVPELKVSSGDLTNGPFLVRMGRAGLPVILSTGMGTLAEVEGALGALAYGYLGGPRAAPSPEDYRNSYVSSAGQAYLSEKVTLLHCTTEYPAPLDSVHLASMDTLASAFGLPVGYSDHTMDNFVSIAAVARGAVCIEKHLTLDRSLPGPDHAASLQPDEFAYMVRAIRGTSVAIGSPRKLTAVAEAKNLIAARRSVVAARAVAKGVTLTEDMLAYKRPGDGLSPMLAGTLLGRVATRSYEPDEAIELGV